MKQFNFSFKVNGDNIYLCWKNLKIKVKPEEVENFFRSNNLIMVSFQNICCETVLNNTRYQFYFNEKIKTKKGEVFMFNSVPKFEKGMTPVYKRTVVVFLPGHKARITTDWVKLKINLDTLEIEDCHHRKHIYIWDGEKLNMEEK